MKNSAFVILLVVCVALSGCYPPPDRPARWARAILDQLECGMSLEEVQALTDKEIRDIGGDELFFGTHVISTNWHSLWFFFEDGTLQATAWGVVEDSKSSRLSPRHNLCTGELSYRLRTSWTIDFVGSDVYLDGELLVEDARVIPLTELSAGHHVLRIERPDGRVVVRELQLGPTDRGDQYLSLEGDIVESRARTP